MTHMLSRAQLESLLEATDMRDLATRLRHHGLVPASDIVGESPWELEVSLRRWAATQWRIVSRWCGPRSEVLSVLFEDEDRRSLRAIIRGAAHGATAEARLAGLVPTPILNERMLQELAGLGTVAAIASVLTAWRHPYAKVVAAHATEPEAPLFALEVAINRTFASRSLRGARKGGVELDAYVRQVIDLENAWTALVLSGTGQEPLARASFVHRGGELSESRFLGVVRSDGTAKALMLLRSMFARTTLAVVFAKNDVSAFETETLKALINEQNRRARMAPVGPSPIILFALRLRAQQLDLRNIVWGLSLTAPVNALKNDLVAAA